MRSPYRCLAELANLQWSVFLLENPGVPESDHDANMSLFDEMKPRSGKASASKRERDLARQLQKLMEIEDEETLKKALEQDFGIGAKDPRYQEVLKIWREAV